MANQEEELETLRKQVEVAAAQTCTKSMRGCTKTVRAQCDVWPIYPLWIGTLGGGVTKRVQKCVLRHKIKLGTTL